MRALAATALALVTGCGHATRSGYLYVPPPERAWLRVYPVMAQPGTDVVVQTRLLTYTEQCLVHFGPDGLEHARSCAAASARLWHTTATTPGLHRIVLESDEARLVKTLCVVGSEDPDACTDRGWEPKP